MRRLSAKMECATFAMNSTLPECDGAVFHCQPRGQAGQPGFHSLKDPEQIRHADVYMSLAPSLHAGEYSYDELVAMLENPGEIIENATEDFIRNLAITTPSRSARFQRGPFSR